MTELHVAAGVLVDPAGNVLIAERPAGAHMAGSWEFPGGKIAAGETPLAGLVRELNEELGIGVRYARHLLRYSHAYPDRRVYLYFWKVLRWDGEPHGREGQALQWLPPDALLAAGLLPADAAVVAALEASTPVNFRPWEACAAACTDVSN